LSIVKNRMHNETTKNMSCRPKNVNKWPGRLYSTGVLFIVHAMQLIGPPINFLEKKKGTEEVK